MPVAEALARAAAGELTTDSALVTLDFALRRGLLGTGLEPADARAGSTLRQAFEALLHPVAAVDAGPVIQGTGR